MTHECEVRRSRLTRLRILRDMFVNEFIEFLI